MNYNKVFWLIICCSIFATNLVGQRKGKKIKPIYFGKIQGAFLSNHFIPNGFSNFNYGNISIRKITGKKIREIGIESFYSAKKQNIVLNPSTLPGAAPYLNGFLQTVFSANLYYYAAWKQWQFSKLKVQVGPQFSLGYFHQRHEGYVIAPSIGTTYNDFKIGASGKIELIYPINNRFSIIGGTQFTLMQFGVRRMDNGIITLDITRRRTDFIQVDVLIQRYVAHIGVLTQFGKIKKDKAKIKRKRDKRRQKKKENLQNKRDKKSNNITKQRLKSKNEKAKKKAKQKKKAQKNNQTIG
jgi:hypothetical protein